jgi:glycosyltransferase involved in cell wall biosynthesis
MTGTALSVTTMTEMKRDGGQHGKRVLIIHRYFWPDTPPYGWMLKSISARLTLDEHRVTVLTSQPSYNPAAKVPRQPSSQNLNGVEVIRLSLLGETKANWVLRGVNAILFAMQVAAHILARPYDVVMAATTPPVLLARIASWASSLRGARFVYHCQDIHPEVMRASGLMHTGIWYRTLRALDAATCKAAAAIVVLSEDMRTAIAKRLEQGADKVRVINNFDLDAGAETASELPPSLRKRSGVFRALFAGNIGRFQGLDKLVEASLLLGDRPDFELMFLGDGVAVPALQAQAGALLGKTVRFHGYQPPATAEAVIGTADLAIVSLNPEIYRYAYPSKVMSYLKQGAPLLVLMEENSELARMVTAERIGYVCAQDSAREIASTIAAALSDAAAAPPDRDGVRRIWRDRFSRDAALDHWAALYASI